MAKTINTVAGEPGTLNLHLFRDRDYQKTILFTDKQTGNPLDLAGWTGKAEIRSKKICDCAPDPCTCVLETFTVNVFGSEGKVVLALTDTETLALALDTGEEAYWDLVLTDGSGNRWPYLEGSVVIHETVTRA